MSMSIIKGILVCSLSLSIAPVMMSAQEKPAKAPSQDPSTYMQVSAPFAQALVVKVKAAHDDQVVKLARVPSAGQP
jgi:hypothetical protein